jgi:hypothetical protein
VREFNDRIEIAWKAVNWSRMKKHPPLMKQFRKTKTTRSQSVGEMREIARMWTVAAGGDVIKRTKR